MERNKITNRIISLDVTRSLAIMLVVLCHSVEVVYNVETGDDKLSTLSCIFNLLSFTLGRLGVPLFLFLSGTLLLSKKFDIGEDFKRFYKHNFLRLLITIEIWNILYGLILLFCGDSNVFNGGANIKDMILYVCFFKLVPFVNMWYCPMILGVYIFIPFVSSAVKKGRCIILPLIISIVFVFFVPFSSQVLQFFSIGSINSQLDLSFSGGCYGIYLVTGFIIYHWSLLRKIHLDFLVTLFILFLFGTILFLYDGFISSLWYNFVGLFLCSTCLYEMILRINVKGKIAEIATDISKKSFGIFFIHIILIKIIEKTTIISSWSVSKPLSVLVVYGIVFIISYLIVSLFWKLPHIRKYVFMS